MVTFSSSFFLVFWTLLGTPFVIEHRLCFIDIERFYFPSRLLCIVTACRFSLCYLIPALAHWYRYVLLYHLCRSSLCYWIKSLVHWHWTCSLHCDRLWFIGIDFSFFFGIVTTSRYSLCYWTPSGSLISKVLLLLLFVCFPSRFLCIVTTCRFSLCYRIPSLAHWYCCVLVNNLCRYSLCYWIPSQEHCHWTFVFVLWTLVGSPLVTEYGLWFIDTEGVFFSFSLYFDRLHVFPLLFDAVSGSLILLHSCFPPLSVLPLLLTTVSGSLTLDVFLCTVNTWRFSLCYWIPSLVIDIERFSLYCEHL